MKPNPTTEQGTGEGQTDLFKRALADHGVQKIMRAFPGVRIISVQRLPNSDQAHRMLTAFASVGAMHFDVTLRDDCKDQEAGFQSRRSVQHLRQSIARRLKAAAEAQYSVIIRPRSSKALLVQLDDYSDDQTAKIAHLALLTLKTSPGNNQIWIAVSDGPKESDKEAAKLFRTRVRRGAGADHSATGATRIAGSINFKPKYAPNFPLVTIGQLNTGKTVTVLELDRAGLIAPLDPPPCPPASVPRTKLPTNTPKLSNPAHWPDWQRALRGAPLKGDGTPDRSMADFMFCKWAAQRGHSVTAIASKLAEVSEKAKERIRAGDIKRGDYKGYCLLTAENGAKAYERDRQYRHSL